MFRKEKVLELQKLNLLCSWRRQNFSCLPLERCWFSRTLPLNCFFVVCWKVSMETSFSFCWSTRSFRVLWFWWNFLICLLLFTFLQQKSLLDVSKKRAFNHFAILLSAHFSTKKDKNLVFLVAKLAQKKELLTILPFYCLRTFQGKRTKAWFF